MRVDRAIHLWRRVASTSAIAVPAALCMLACEAVLDTSGLTERGSEDGGGPGSGSDDGSGSSGGACSSKDTRCHDGVPQTCKEGAWTDAACKSGEVCSGTDSTCTPGCVVGGQFYNPGDPSPSNSCDVCDPTMDTSGFSKSGEGATCEGDKECCSDSCKPKGTCTTSSGGTGGGHGGGSSTGSGASTGTGGETGGSGAGTGSGGYTGSSGSSGAGGGVSG